MTLEDPQAVQSAAAIEDAVSATQGAVADPSLANLGTAINAGEGVAKDPGLINLVQETPAIVSETRRGWKTTEFWGIIAAVFADIGPIDIHSKDKLIVTGLAAFYAVARGLAKAGAPNVAPA